MAGWTGGRVLAHAQLDSVTPANDEVVASAPTEVVLRFSEPVSLTGGSVRVLDDQAEPVSDEPVLEDETITVPLPSGLPDGTYTVTYEVVSADSHRIAGASVFHVGAPSSGGVVVPDVGSQVGWGIRLGGVVFSAIGYGGALIACGVLWLTIYADRSRPFGRRPDPRAGAASALDRRWDAVTVRAAVLGAVAMIAATPFRIARVGGGLDALRDNELIRASLRGPIGLSMAVTVLALFAVAVAVDQRAPGWLGTGCGLVALVGFTLEGHTRASRQGWMIAFDVVHLTAAAVWLGGLVGLVIAFRFRPPGARLVAMVRRFSSAAVAAVVAVSVAGVVMAWVILPGVGELTSTGWGLALIAKVALVVVVIGIGLFNNRRLVPTVGGHADNADNDRNAGDDGGSLRRLGRLVTVEALLLLAVVAVTAVLVTRSPASSGVTAAEPSQTDPAGSDGPTASVAVELSDGGTATVLLSPARVGANAVEVMLRDSEGRAVNPVEAPTVELTQAELGVGPLAVELTPIFIGDYEGTIELSYAGTWELAVRVRTGEFDSVVGTGEIVVGD